jgi:formylglycine-generating enzyme required for sulfatase activity
MRALVWTAVVLWLAACGTGCGKDNPTGQRRESDIPKPQWAHASRTTAAAITLSWTDAALGEAGYVVERSLNAGSGFATIATLDANQQDYVDPDVVTGTRYYYRIRTRDTLGRLSEPTPVFWVDAAENQTPDLPSNPDPPNKGFDLDLPRPVTLTWQMTDPDGPPPHAWVYFGEARDAITLVASDLGTANYVRADSLALSRFYFWRIVAIDEHGATALSPVWNFGTRMERFGIPGGPFVQGDCGHFSPGDSSIFCPPFSPGQVEAFNMDKYEVSNQLFAQFLNDLLEDQWVRVVGGRVSSKVGDTLFAEVYPLGDEHSGIEFVPAGSGPGVFVPRGGRENHPVVEVSWHGANRFAQHFGRRLPTEAEWEKAARGTSSELGWVYFESGDAPDSVGLGFPYPWGDSPDPRYFNFLGSGDPFEARVGVGTTPIGYYDGYAHGGYATRSNQSPYGIYDLAGNVAEWCTDLFVPYGGGTSSGLRSIRGGGWRSSRSSCQTFWREAMSPDSTDNLVGFRTVASE